MPKALVVLLFPLIFSCTGSKLEYSPFNDRKPAIEPGLEYSFIVGGHLYGKQNTSYYPANTLTVNVAEINQSKASFFIGLGDLVRESDSIHFSFFKSLFTDNLRIPFYNAVGNHDVRDRDYYESVFGKTYFHFIQNEDLFIFLDTELDSGRIEGKQLVFLKKTLKAFSESASSANVFVFMHKLIWNDLPGLEILKDHSNQVYTWLDTLYYEKQLQPLFANVSNPLYIFSGDIGTPVSYSLFHYKDRKSEITYIANGLGDNNDDALIQVNVGSNKKVNFKVLSLTDARFDDLKDYSIEYWNERFSSDKEKSNKYLMSLFAVVLFLIILVVIRRKLFKKDAINIRSQ